MSLLRLMATRTVLRMNLFHECVDYEDNDSDDSYDDDSYNINRNYNSSDSDRNAVLTIMNMK